MHQNWCRSNKNILHLLIFKFKIKVHKLPPMHASYQSDAICDLNLLIEETFSLNPSKYTMTPKLFARFIHIFGVLESPIFDISNGKYIFIFYLSIWKFVGFQRIIIIHVDDCLFTRAIKPEKFALDPFLEHFKRLLLLSMSVVGYQWLRVVEDNETDLWNHYLHWV